MLQVIIQQEVLRSGSTFFILHIIILQGLCLDSVHTSQLGKDSPGFASEGEQHRAGVAIISKSSGDARNPKIFPNNAD